MPVEPTMALVKSLRERLDAKPLPPTVVLGPGDADFRQYAKRWSNIDIQTPGAIVLPTSETAIQEIVKWARETSTQFVVKSGGHGLWSTINGNGIVIDLSHFSGIHIETDKEQATLKGTILTKEVAVALAKVGRFAAVGNSNRTGAIPYFLGAGAPCAAFLTGFGADNILAARMVTAEGELVVVNEDTHPDLLWALRGAGYYFGVITELTVRIHPLSTLGTKDGTLSTYLAGFSLERAEEVCSAVKIVAEDNRLPATGIIMAMAPPPAWKPAIVVSAKYFGDPLEAKEVFSKISCLGPAFEKESRVAIQDINDALDPQDIQGDYKEIRSIGLHAFEISAFLRTIRLWEELIEECPDAIETFFGFKWESQRAAVPPLDSAMSLRDIRYWQLNLIKCTKEENVAKVQTACEKSFAIQRRTGERNSRDFVDFVPSNRSGPIEHRFRGEERLMRLKALKKEWDPHGVFTTQLL